MVSYDPSVINKFAQKLYDRASFTTIAYVIFGATIGAVFGKYSFEVAGMYVGAVFAGVTGYFIGSQRAFSLKLQAQTALCQVQIEHNTQGLFASKESFRSEANLRDQSTHEVPVPTSDPQDVASVAKGNPLEPVEISSGGWVCRACTGKNEPGDSDCRYCRAVRTV